MASAPEHHRHAAVAEAALAMVRGTTDAATRTAASQFLEQWTRTREAWDVYSTWLHSLFANTPQAGHHHHVSPQEQLGMQLLCLTLLQAKIRREVPRGTTELFPALTRIRHELWTLLLSLSTSSSHEATTPTALGPLCVCTAALTARCGNLSELITTCCCAASTATSTNASPRLSPRVALKLLASIPSELEACSDLTTPQSELWPCMDRVLEFIRHCWISTDAASTLLPAALEALREWSQTCHVTLSHLDRSTHNGGEALLSMLIRLLSSSDTADEQVLIMASRALTEAILVPSDSCTPSRQAAVSRMLSAVQETGFVVHPLQHATHQQWDDACHALSTLICTLVTEDIDDICAQSSEALLTVLLHLQSHPRISVTLPVLECWLTVQEIPTSERHVNWTQPLFRQVVQGLIVRVAYPIDEDDLEDEAEFAELRRMVTDVLISSYFLMRAEYLQQISSLIVNIQQPWNAVEAALFGLYQVSREVCARIKARAGGESVRADKEATARQLLQLVNHLLQHQPQVHQHPLVQKGIAKFLGSYAPAWNMHCAPEAILQLVAYLHQQHENQHDETAKAIRSIYVGCSAKLLEGPQPLVVKSIQDTMEAALLSIASSGAATTEALSAVTEGSTRLLMHMKDLALVRQAFGQMVNAVLPRADHALQVVPSSNVVESNAALEALVKYLRVLRTMIQFCDGEGEITDGTTAFHPLGDLVESSLWPFLERVSHQAGSYDVILEEVLAIHRQLLSNNRSLVEARFSDTIKSVVEALERTKHPSTLEYMACAVESFSGKEEASFGELLSHVTKVICAYVATEKKPHSCPQLIRAFFELNQRYVMFHPSALVGCHEFATIVALAVECLSACMGERESTRATLIFLTQLFGWRSLRLLDASTSALESSSGRIDELLLQHGETVTRACITGLAGGSPQMLWPSLSDCLFAIVTHIAGGAAAGPVVEETTIAHQWIHNALMSSCANTQISPETCQQIMSILFGLARDAKSKPKAKMLLTDFAKI